MCNVYDLEWNYIFAELIALWKLNSQEYYGPVLIDFFGRINSVYYMVLIISLHYIYFPIIYVHNSAMQSSKVVSISSNALYFSKSKYLLFYFINSQFFTLYFFSFIPFFFSIVYSFFIRYESGSLHAVDAGNSSCNLFG